MTCIGLLLPFKDFVLVMQGFLATPTMGFAFEVGMFMSLFLLLAWVYQHSDLLKWNRVRPFLRESLLFRHTHRTNEDVFAKEEQQHIAALARTDEEKGYLAERARKERIPIDRQKELQELKDMRTQRKAEAGKEEIASLNNGNFAEITDICRLHQLTESPHPLFPHMFRLTIDPGPHACRAHIVFSASTRQRLSGAKQWFRFKQDLFDFAESLYYQEWMERFKQFYDMLELECYREEADSFGLPGKTSFLRVDLPTDVIEQYKDGVLIATELENMATISWLEERSS